MEADEFDALTAGTNVRGGRPVGVRDLGDGNGGVAAACGHDGGRVVPLVLEMFGDSTIETDRDLRGDLDGVTYR